jgi:hypothetical protein
MYLFIFLKTEKGEGIIYGGYIIESIHHKTKNINNA